MLMDKIQRGAKWLRDKLVGDPSLDAKTAHVEAAFDKLDHDLRTQANSDDPLGPLVHRYHNQKLVRDLKHDQG